MTEITEKIFSHNSKLYGVCQDCEQLVRIDKPLLGSLHFCHS